MFCFFFFFFFLFFFFDFFFWIFVSFFFLFLFFLIGPFMIGSFFFFDFFSWSFVCLSMALFIFSVLGSVFIYNFDLGGCFFFFLKGFLSFFLFFCFSLLNSFFFFLFFECSVLPIFLMILGWGFSAERLIAGFYMFMYTLVFSLPFLYFVFSFFFLFGTLDFLFFFCFYDFFFGFVFIFLSLMVFMVSFPCYFFHIWLPKAHVEAPLSGSMILAGVLLKLGGYGFFRFFYFFEGFFYFIFCFLFIGVFGSLFSGLICFRQVDLKCMVAYMSISHMGLVITSFFSLGYFSFFGFFFVMLAHGFSSSSMFVILGIFYDRSLTRSVYLLKSGFFSFGVFCFWSFLVCVSNMSCPPTMNFFSELVLTWGIFSFGNFFFLFFFFLILMVSCFCSIHYFVSLFHGNYFSSFYMDGFYVRESFLFFCHLFPLYAFFFVF